MERRWILPNWSKIQDGALHSYRRMRSVLPPMAGIQNQKNNVSQFSHKPANNTNYYHSLDYIVLLLLYIITHHI